MLKFESFTRLYFKYLNFYMTTDYSTTIYVTAVDYNIKL